jgi:hypothetical protein
VFTLVFSGALIHTGALMATMMTGNVFFVIMPNQRKNVAALLAGKQPDPKWVKTSKTRSTHSNYITLPVLFPMLSNHYPMTCSNSRVIPLIVTCIIIAGALVRYFHNAWHADHDKAPWRAWAAAAAAIICAFGVAPLASPGMRGLMGLADLSGPFWRAGSSSTRHRTDDSTPLGCRPCGRGAARLDDFAKFTDGPGSHFTSEAKAPRPPEM